MLPITQIANDRTALMDAVRALRLDEHFSRATLKAAEALASQAAGWRGPVAWYQPDGSHAQALQAEALEADRGYTVTVYLYPHLGIAAVETLCTCELPACGHAAALLLRLQRLADWPRRLTPLQRWQLTLPALSNSTPAPASVRPRASGEVFALLRCAHGTPPTPLLARLVLLEPAGKRQLALEDIAAAEELAPQLLLWQARLGRAPRPAHTKETGYLLQGAEGAALLEEWLYAGICRHADTLEPIRPAAARPPQWAWVLDSQGHARLRLCLSADESTRAVELNGLHYLNEATGEFGAITLPPAAWTMIERMPSIDPGETALRTGWPPHPLLNGIPAPPPPPHLDVLRVPLTPVIVISASRRLEHEEYVFHVTAWADYNGCRLALAEVPWQNILVRRVASVYTQVHRDIDGEVEARRMLPAAEWVRLRSLLPDAWRTLTPAPDARALAHRQHYRGGARAFTALDGALRALSTRGFRVEYDPQLPFAVLPEQTPLRASLHPAENPGWTQFQLTATHQGGDIDVLPIVLKGLERRAFSLTPLPNEAPDARWLAPVGTDQFLPLPLSGLREWLSPLLMYVGQRPPADARELELPDAQAIGLSDCLKRQDVAVEGPQAARIAGTLSTLRAAQHLPCPVPNTFRGRLRQYQSEGLKWLQALRQAALGGILADDMGLGKTVQVIAHLLVEREAGRLTRPALIVAPTTLVFNWLDELANFAPSLRCINFTGKDRLIERDRLADAHVIIVSYALLVNELPTLRPLEYHAIVLDEAQWIKNPFTQTARSVRELRAAHRLVLTGTPLENHLGELWAHMDVVMPGYLGDPRTFKRGFRVPIEQHQDDRRMLALRELIGPFVLRRTKAQVAPELPPKTETILRVSMHEDQRTLYESLRLSLSQEVRQALENYTDGQSRIVVLSALMRLRQVCCDPRLIDKTGTEHPRSAKLEALLTLVRGLRAEHRQVLVFSQFTSMLDLIAQALHEAHLPHTILTGDTADRRTPVQRFQTGGVGILLASLKAGGVGLNLTAADAVIHYDPWWNPAVERQATDRAHRIGREQPVFIYELLCENTIEEKIVAMKERKSDLADAVLGDGPTLSGVLTALDVQHLFDLPSSNR